MPPARPKVGHIEFLNCFPLYYGLVKNYALLDIDLVKGTPTELNNLLINGVLDISPISSIEYAHHHDSLLLFPDFTVSSDGDVKSIILLSCFPLEKLNDKKIALTTTSATSNVLLKLILSKGYNIHPEYVTLPPDVCRIFTEADAALLIGDIALKYYLCQEDFYVYDLGVEWKKFTGHKMVYAAWAVNRNFADRNYNLCEYVFSIFKKSMLYSKTHLSEIAEFASRWEAFDKSFLEDYFKSLRFDFGEEYQKGLLYFYRLANEAGELNTIPELKFINFHSA